MKNLLSLLIAFFAFAALVSAEPKIQVEGGDTYNWGDVWQKDSPLKASVKIFNKGDDTLLIHNVKPGCGCTVAPIDKNVLAPGDFATMNVELKVDNNVGPVTKSITITSNDPKTLNLYYYLKANVKSMISSSPNFISFNSVQINQEGISKVTLTNNLDKAVTFKDYVIVPEGLDVKLPKDFVLEGKKSVEMIVTYKSAKAGPIAGAIIIKTDSPEVDKVRLQVGGNVFDPNYKAPAPSVQGGSVQIDQTPVELEKKK